MQEILSKNTSTDGNARKYQLLVLWILQLFRLPFGKGTTQKGKQSANSGSKSDSLSNDKLKQQDSKSKAGNSGKKDPPPLKHGGFKQKFGPQNGIKSMQVPANVGGPSDKVGLKKGQTEWIAQLAGMSEA